MFDIRRAVGEKKARRIAGPAGFADRHDGEIQPSVGAGLPANAVCQATSMALPRRFRWQASSHRD